MFDIISDSDNEKEKSLLIMSSVENASFVEAFDTVIRRKKINRAAILDHQGNSLVIMAGWRVLPDEGMSLLRALRSARRTEMWKLRLFEEEFMCFPCDEKETILGRSHLTVIVAHLTRKYIVVGLAPVDTPGSCLHEMKTVWTEIEEEEE